ncbi:MAG: hydroxymethylpyrimidine kinase / phosphomethylpyrimidine kinase / thiamine-phosphate diphosphorylase [Fimbriimonadaceae bacterium]|nr:hydroxymethylpyrimidine kinase / phosphomethylpyrimidine kinase / thiamine-phosphate diphosphorylase [Fimbriimonadaceae bacterium]
MQLVEPDVLRAQIEQAFKTYDIGAVKIGMLGSAVQVKTVVQALQGHPSTPVVLDPVLASSSGKPFLDEEGKRALMQDLLPIATIVTPNVPELAILTDKAVEAAEQRLAAGAELMQRGARSVLIKGGHLDDPTDVLLLPESGPISYGRSTVKVVDARGTGCILASFIAAGLANGLNPDAAMKIAKSEMNRALLGAFVAAENSPGLLLTGHQRLTQDGASPPELSGIYFVTDSRLNPEISHMVGARLALEGGARIIQLRDKRLSTPELINLAKRMRGVTRNHGAIFIINDRVDLALAVDAEGVHLGPEDMSPEDARSILGWSKIIGVSVSTVEEAQMVAPYASYLAVGAIFGSSTKNDAGDAVGVERITDIRQAFPEKKIVAIGGINLSNVAFVAAAGADAAAVVSAIICASDPAQATRDLVAEFEKSRQRA